MVEAGLYDNSYVKNDAGWKIQSLRYHPIERADPPNALTAPAGGKFPISRRRHPQIGAAPGGGSP